MLLGAAGLALALASAVCSGPRTENKRISATYDSKTGRLTLLTYDSKGSGKPDTFSYMDGTRFVRIEIDTDGDGKIDRWEHYDLAQKLEKVGFSRPNDGKEDAWAYSGPDGSRSRIDVSTHRDGRADRKEFYEHGLLARAEEDSDGDGLPDKWEVYDGGRLVSVAFDLGHTGKPDRRLIYGSNGEARLELDPLRIGRFVAVSDAPQAVRKNGY